jgi:signal transduction histidine kinase
VCPNAPSPPAAADPATVPSDLPASGKGQPDPNQLASHLQASIEVERSHLTRQLHDDLGGLLVGALMDVAWVEARLQAPELQAKLGRARDSLRAAVDLKRNLIEGMRPTLLENVGIFAAMRWHFAKYCEAADLKCIAHLSGAEPALKTNVAIGVYRITEEALRLISGPLKARSISLTAEVSGLDLKVLLAHDGVALSDEQLADLAEFKSMAQRVSTLEGSYTVTRTADNLLQWTILVPIESADWHGG